MLKFFESEVSKRSVQVMGASVIAALATFYGTLGTHAGELMGLSYGEVLDLSNAENTMLYGSGAFFALTTLATTIKIGYDALKYEENPQEEEKLSVARSTKSARM